MMGSKVNFEFRRFSRLGTMRTLICLSAILISLSTAIANVAPEVTNVIAQQNAEPSELVRITYDLFDADGDQMTVSLMVSSDGGVNWSVQVNTTAGDIGPGISSGVDRSIIWNAGIDYPGHVGSHYEARIIADDGVISNYAMHFGNTSYGDVPDDPDINFGGGNFTLEAWMRCLPNGQNYDYYLIGKGFQNGNYYDMQLGTATRVGQISFGCRGSSGERRVWSGIRVDNNAWHHVAGVRSSSSMKIYVDGVERGSVNQTPGTITTAAPLGLGNWSQFHSRQFLGDFDEIRIWGVARTQGEIVAAMHSELVGNEANLRALFQFNEGAGSIITDNSEHVPNGVLGGNFSYVPETW